MWKIDKTIEFCYGHRVWTQKLEEEFTDGDASCKCRHLHGHQAKVQIFLEAQKLDPQGMVTDFKHLGWAKKFFDDYIDHKFIMDVNDPLYISMIDKYWKIEEVLVPGTEFVAGKIINLDAKPNKPEPADREYYESYFFVNFIPTSENLSKWTYDLVQAKMSKLDINVARVDWWETPKSRSSYER